ncbi:murein hydrolase activator EnvC [Photorhabdus laumondii subsp. laumondii]|uniref:Murein hydrolase activator EnvC n=1 Tax=Photorhabdus laumondii subsp. laumondii TaxID=141679 RepID=A0A6L9JKK0_PHOLM|nr:murein hydrolase activator EnvC [Photorhabdus laumondii]MCC8386016.1 murein hydrolase activator EnvC [Photorhabdus laumondii]MCC8415026.1 murein hydrolase activator EnvC [Photorhabdus laumondii]NDK94723.1 murein hydrolase activator EnvC [Photorhabdus laumondii subsp. laumondii]NDL21023.1 murein hydrolase activator EnvC [Photorhabdus laumondii subsp. laumondii]NDL29993.1 murein hydrolase activator EnvC [Photorhabdus laumondii subsp. laumondii]
MADDKEMHSRNYRRNQNSRRNDIFALLFYVFLLVIFSFNTFANQIIDNKNQLKDLQQNIAEKEKSVQQQQQKRSSLLNQLKDQENTISKIGQSLHNTQTQLSKLNKEITFLVSNIKKLEKQQKAQRDMLARQLDAAFRQGQYQGLELMFRGEEGKRGERILAYYSYLNQARQDTIVKLEQTAVDLTEQKKLEQQKQEEQKQVLTEQQQQKQQMEVARNARQKTLSELESSLKKDQKNLAELKQNETRLRDKIAKAEREAKARAEREAREAARVRAQIAAKQKQAQQKGSSYKPTEDERALMARTGGLGRPAGQAIWPVHGKVIHQFGEALQGELRWKGMVISATEGTEVKAISDGRVLLADWLQGYGLVVVIEHGKGDMSLYGYNQSALVSVGQQVRAGQPIALVGNSGGQQQPALYFEIRRQGRAVNPQPWLGR